MYLKTHAQSSIFRHTTDNKKALKSNDFKLLGVLGNPRKQSLVEAGGIEPPSESPLQKRSTYLVLPIWKSHSHHADRRALREPATLNLILN